VRLARELGPTVFHGTASCALELAQLVRREEIAGHALGFRAFLLSTEAGASLGGVKRRIEDAFGAVCLETADLSATAWRGCVVSDAGRGLTSLAGPGLERHLHVAQGHVEQQVVDDLQDPAEHEGAPSATACITQPVAAGATAWATVRASVAADSRS
jgi:hypothetical protein